MPFLGDLERFVATSIYPYRLAIASLAIAALAGLAALAVRRWVAVARRHPARAGLLVAVAALIVVPAAWFPGPRCSSASSSTSPRPPPSSARRTPDCPIPEPWSHRQPRARPQRRPRQRRLRLEPRTGRLPRRLSCARERSAGPTTSTSGAAAQPLPPRRTGARASGSTNSPCARPTLRLSLAGPVRLRGGHRPRPAAGNRRQLQHADPARHRRDGRAQRGHLVQGVRRPVRGRSARRLTAPVRATPAPAARAADRPGGCAP
jgi:hypothetical protein